MSEQECLAAPQSTCTSMQANREQIIASKVASHMPHTGISASTRSLLTLSTLRCAARHECQGYQFSSHGKYVACEIFFRRIDKVLPIPGYTCRIRPLPPLPVRFLSSPPLPPPRPVSPSPPPPPSPPSPPYQHRTVFQDRWKRWASGSAAQNG